MISRTPSFPNRWHCLYFAVWACGLLAPQLWVATTRQSLPPVLGVRWERLYHISGVFSGRVTRWRCNYIEMRFAGSKTWEDFRTDLYSSIHPSGGRNRLDRMLDDSSASHGGELRRRMAQYIVQKHRQLFPKSAAVEELRFVRVWFDAGSPALARPAGAWVHPPLRLVPAKDRKILSTHRFQKGKIILPATRFQAPVVFGDAELRALLEKGTRWDSLDLTGSQITAGLLPLLVEKLPGLKHLSLAGTGYTDAWGGPLGRLSQLTSVDLSRTKAGSSSANWLTSLKFLRTLRLDDTAVDAWMAGRLRGMPGLESLSLARTKTGADILLDLTPWPQLRHLSVAGCALLEGQLAKLKGGTTLESLDLSGIPLSDSDLRALRRLPKLKELRLDGVPLPAAGLAELRELRRLESLSLEGTTVTKAQAESLRGHPTLKKIVAADGIVTLTPAPSSTNKSMVPPKPSKPGVPPVKAPATTPAKP
ncbi:MAG: hypothetical protein HS117_21155 [Verrucomicrobiaceae bacterium]|nr:hypothetical protein [Verrucomicrobiaceae bacterium]